MYKLPVVLYKNLFAWKQIFEDYLWNVYQGTQARQPMLAQGNLKIQFNWRILKGAQSFSLCLKNLLCPQNACLYHPVNYCHVVGHCLWKQSLTWSLEIYSFCHFNGRVHVPLTEAGAWQAEREHAFLFVCLLPVLVCQWNVNMRIWRTAVH